MPSLYAFLCLKKKGESPIKEKKRTASWCFCLIINVTYIAQSIGTHPGLFLALTRAKYKSTFDKLKF